MKTLILTDIHVGKSESLAWNGLIRQANTQALETLKKTVPHLNQQKFDLTMQLGDLLRDVGNAETDAVNFDSAVSELAKLNPSPIHLPGNHDLHVFSNSEYSAHLEKYGFQQNTYGSKMQGGYKIIWLDFIRDAENRKLLSAERLTWLRKELDYTGECLIFGHYPLKNQDFTGSVYFASKDKKTGFAYDNADEIADILLHGQAKVRAYVGGHVHWIGSYTIGQIPCFIAPSFTENIAATAYPENNPGIYSTLEVNDQNLIFKSYSGEYCFVTLEG